MEQRLGGVCGWVGGTGMWVSERSRGMPVGISGRCDRCARGPRRDAREGPMARGSFDPGCYDGTWDVPATAAPANSAMKASTASALLAHDDAFIEPDAPQSRGEMPVDRRMSVSGGRVRAAPRVPRSVRAVANRDGVASQARRVVRMGGWATRAVFEHSRILETASHTIAVQNQAGKKNNS